LKKKSINYELTPLRTEGKYGDFRHPGEIQRSNDIILDAHRRDFTINAMYYFSIAKQTKAKLDFTPAEKQIDEKSLIKILEKEGYCYIANLNMLILRNEQYIQQVFENAKFDETYFRYLVETQKEGYFWSNTTPTPFPKRHSKKESFRMLIDPTGGINGLINRKLETVGEADRRFGEDALRLMRALRIVNVVNTVLLYKEGDKKQTLFDFTSETRDSIARNTPLLAHIAKERIKDELTKVFIKGNPF
jgi:hypothetical protein